MSTVSALAAKTATTSIPIVFVVGEEPVRSSFKLDGWGFPTEVG
jgi:hypothetical protein